MTAKRPESTPAFRPVTLTMETQEEFDVVYQIMNCLHRNDAESIADRCDLTREQIMNGSYNTWETLTLIYNSNT